LFFETLNWRSNWSQVSVAPVSRIVPPCFCRRSVNSFACVFPFARNEGDDALAESEKTIGCRNTGGLGALRVVTSWRGRVPDPVSAIVPASAISPWNAAGTTGTCLVTARFEGAAVSFDALGTCIAGRARPARRDFEKPL